MKSIVTLIVFFVFAGLPLCSGAGPNSGPSPAMGRLRIWAPAGVVGDNYWIYVNGHLASAPPHSNSGPFGSIHATPIQTTDGWHIWKEHGPVLKMTDYGWDRDYSPYDLDPQARDALHLFQAVELPLPSGKYVIDIAILLPALPYRSSFPFVVDDGWQKEVGEGKTTELYLTIPHAWESHVPPTVFLSPCRGNHPDPDELKRKLSAYMNDSTVTALRGADASFLSRGKGVVVLDLPPEQGGSREFDGKQIKYIADAVANRANLPRQSDIEDCQRSFPQFADYYAEYGKTIRFIADDIESFRKLAARLDQGQ
jgi:hypothetical protein